MAEIFHPLDFIGWFGGKFSRELSLDRNKGTTWYSSNDRTPIWVDTNNLYDVYQSCPPLFVILNTKAEMLANGCLKVRKKSDKSDVEKHWSLDLLKNPNPLRSQRSYIYEYSLYTDIYANNFNYRNSVYGSKPRAIWNLDPEMIKVVPTGKWIDQVDLKGIIDHYEFLQGRGDIRKMSTDEVLHSSEGLSKSIVLSESKIIGLKPSISNIIGAYKTRNIFIYKGPKLFISNGATSDQAIMLGPDEKTAIERQANQDYGLNDAQSHTVITNATLKLDKTSYPTKDMMLFEEVEEDFGMICSAYEMDRDLFPSTKGATNENKKQGEQRTYNGCISTAAESFCNFHDKLFSLDAEGLELYMDFSHLSVMQADDGQKASALKTRIDGIIALVAQNVINPKQAQALLLELTGLTIDETLASNNKILDVLTEMSPLIANNLSQSLTTNQVLSIFALPGIGPEGDKPRSQSNQNPTTNAN